MGLALGVASATVATCYSLYHFDSPIEGPLWYLGKLISNIFFPAEDFIKSRDVTRHISIDRSGKRGPCVTCPGYAMEARGLADPAKVAGRFATGTESDIVRIKPENGPLKSLCTPIEGLSYGLKADVLMDPFSYIYRRIFGTTTPTLPSQSPETGFYSDNDPTLRHRYDIEYAGGKAMAPPAINKGRFNTKAFRARTPDGKPISPYQRDNDEYYGSYIVSSNHRGPTVFVPPRAVQMPTGNPIATLTTPMVADTWHATPTPLSGVLSIFDLPRNVIKRGRLTADLTSVTPRTPEEISSIQAQQRKAVQDFIQQNVSTLGADLVGLPNQSSPYLSLEYCIPKGLTTVGNRGNYRNGSTAGSPAPTASSFMPVFQWKSAPGGKNAALSYIMSHLHGNDEGITFLFANTDASRQRMSLKSKA